MPTLLEIRNDPNYINANAATKQAIFDKYSAGDKDYTSANEATKNAIQQRFGLSVAATPEPVDDRGILRMTKDAAIRGGKQTGSLLADVLPAMGASIVGADDYAKKQMEEAAVTQQEIQEKYPARYPTLDAVKGVGDYVPFVLETGAEQVSNLAAALIPGVGGGMLAARGLTGAAALAAKKAGQIGGAFLGSYALNAPEVFQNIHEETGKFAPGAALIAGGIAAGLDSIFPAFILNKFTPGMKMGVVEKLLEKSGMQPGMIRSGLAGLGMGVATEGPTEGAQEAISIMAEKFVSDNKAVWGSKEWNRIIESSVRGAVGGGGISGTLGTIRGIGAKGREEARNEELGGQETPEVTPEITPKVPSETQKIYRNRTGEGVVLGEAETQKGITPEQQHQFDMQYVSMMQKALASGELLSTEEINKLNIIKRREDKYYATQATPDIVSATEKVILKPLEVVEGQEKRGQEFRLQPSNILQQTMPIKEELDVPFPVVNKAQLSFEDMDELETQRALERLRKEAGYTPEALYIPPGKEAQELQPIQIPGQDTKTELTGEQEDFFKEQNIARAKKVEDQQHQQRLARLQELHNNKWEGVLPSQQDIRDFKELTTELPDFKPTLLLAPKKLIGLGIPRQAGIFKRLVGQDISNPKVAAELKKHIGLVTPEVGANIAEFLKRPEFTGVQNGNLRNETSNKTSTKTDTGTPNRGVPTFEKPQDKTGKPFVKKAILPRMVNNKKDNGLPNVGEEAASTTLKKVTPVIKPVIKPVVTEAEFRAQSAKLRAQKIKENQEKAKKEAKKRALEIKKEAIEEAKIRALKAKKIKRITDREKEDPIIKDAEENDLLLRTAPKGTKGISVDEVKKAVDAKATKWVNAPEISVVQSVDKLPAHVQARLKKEVTPKGLFDPRTKKVYLIADHITDSRDAIITLAHEALGHYGLRAVLGNKYPSMMNNIYNTNKAVREAADIKIKKEGLDKNIAVEEVLADMQGDKAVESIWQQLKNLIRQLLQKLGVTKPTDKEINDLLARARDFVVEGVGRGRGRQVEGNEVLASAKVDRLKATGSSKAWIDFSDARKGINFANIKTLEQAKEAAEKHYKEQIKTTPEFDGAAYLEGLTIDDINDYPPEIQDAIQMYKDGNKAGGIQEIFNIVSGQRRENIREWKQYLENINPEMAKDPFWRDYVITSFLKSMRTDKPDTGLSLNANALGQVYEKFKQGNHINFATVYQSALIDTTNDLVELGDETTGWRKIPQTSKNDPKFNKRVKAVKSLSCIGWCTRNTMAAPYIQKGDFWVYVDNKKPQVAIRFEGDKVHEIQGPQNTRAIPTKYIKEITNLVDSGKIKNMTEETKGDIARAVKKSQFEAMIKEKLASGELVEKDRAFARENGITLKAGAKVYVDVDGWITIDGDVYIREGASAPMLTTVGGNVNIDEGASVPALTTVRGTAYIREGASVPALTTVRGTAYIREGVSAPALTTVWGNAHIYKGASAPALTTVGGYVDIGEGVSAPALTTVGGDADILEGASAPALTTVGGGATIYGSAPALTTVGGDAYIYEGASAPALTTVGSHAYIYEGASAPALTTVGGDASIREGASAPALTTVWGNAHIYKGASVPSLTTVGGDANIYKGASAPALTTVGGGATIYGSAPALITVGGYAYIGEGASAPNITKKNIGKEAALKGTPLDPNKQAEAKEDELLYSKKEVEEVDDDIPPEKAKPATTETNVEDNYVLKTDEYFRKKIENSKYIPEGAKEPLISMAISIRNALINFSYNMSFGQDLADMIMLIMPEGNARNAVKEYFKVINKKEAVRSKYNHRIDDIGSRAENVKDRDKLNAYIMWSTKKGKWGFSGGDARTYKDGKSWLEDVKKEDLDKDTVARFNALLPGSQQVAIDIFKHGREYRQELRTLLDKISEEYADKGTGKPMPSFITNMAAANINGPYAPISRFGPYVTVGKSKEWVEHEENDDSDDRIWLKAHRGNEKHYYVEFSDTLGQASKIKRKLEARGFISEYSAKEVYAKGITSAPWDEFYKLKGLIDNEDMLGDGTLNGKDSEKARAHMQQLLVDLYLTSLAENAARKHELHRDYVAGASPDMIRAFVTKGKADAYFFAALDNNNKLTDLINTMRGVLKEKGGSRSDNIRALNMIINRHALSMDYRPTPLQDNAMQFTSFWTLLTKPTYLLQNGTQPIVISVPIMARYTGVGEVKAMKEMMHTYGEISTAFGNDGFIKGFIAGTFNVNLLGKDSGEIDMLKTLNEDGILDTGVSRDLGYWEAQSGLSKPFVKTVHKLNSWVRQVESINRVTTALATYRLAGGGPKGIEAATYVIRTTHGNYSTENAPMIWSKITAGKVLLQFRKFQFIQASLMIRLAHNSAYGSPEEKAMAMRALKWTLAHYMVLTGVMGLPAMAVVGPLIAGLFGDDDEPADFERMVTRGVDNKDISDVLLKGIPAMFGVELQSMIGAQNMLSPLPYTDVNLGERGGFETAVVGLLGPFIGTIKKVADGANMISDGDYYKGLEKILPSGLSKAAQSYRLATEGLTNSKGDLLMDSEEFTGLVILAQALGFRTMKVADIQTRTGNLIDFNAHYKKRTSDIKHRYTEAFKEGDSGSDEMKRLREKYRELQASKRLNGFKPQNMFTLTRAPMEQRKRERGGIDGVLTNKGNRRFVRDDAEDNDDDEE